MKEDAMGLNEMRQGITKELAKMRKNRAAAAMHKELGEMMLKKAMENPDLHDREMTEAVEASIKDSAMHIEKMDELIRMGEMALKIHDMMEDEDEDGE